MTLRSVGVASVLFLLISFETVVWRRPWDVVFGSSFQERDLTRAGDTRGSGACAHE